ncbi:DUF6194 family protein [Microbacterium sp. NPDC019599]|uniref:DUF6194 family protein n=1 Tax=Microbacterium sp. NPDC019599 TaxID=3154690 RepID=UPI0033D52D39
MTMDRILDEVRSFDGLLELAPEPGGPYPEIAWGDHFFYFAPDGQVPANTQPFATIVTKDYPDDASSDLDPDDRWRVNIHVGRALFDGLVGDAAEPIDFAEADAFLPHPVYGSLGWIAVVNPGERTLGRVLELLRGAYRDAVARAERRAQHPST